MSEDLLAPTKVKTDSNDPEQNPNDFEVRRRSHSEGFVKELLLLGNENGLRSITMAHNLKYGMTRTTLNFSGADRDEVFWNAASTRTYLGSHTDEKPEPEMYKEGGEIKIFYRYDDTDPKEILAGLRSMKAITGSQYEAGMGLAEELSDPANQQNLDNTPSGLEIKP